MSKQKNIFALALTIMLITVLSVSVLAAGSGDVAGAVQGTWDTAKVQIKSVVNGVVFPVLDLILAVFFL